MASFIALGFIFIIGWLVIQKFKSQSVLLLGGFGMMLAAYLLGTKVDFVPEKSSTGLWFFDMFQYVNLLSSKDVAGLGLMIMTCTGFAKYMDHIGASSRLVLLALKPLDKLKAPYLVMSCSFIVNMFMSLPVPSASGLAMLMMVTLFPILVRLGVSRIAAASAIATGHILDIGPASATTLLVSQNGEIPINQYFVEYQLPVYIICGLVAAISHYFWQRYLDKKEGLFLDTNSPDFEIRLNEKAKESSEPGPTFYVILPILPLVFLLGFSEYGYHGIKMNVNVAMFMSLAVALVCELCRHRDFRKTCASMQVFFKGMGDQFTMTVTLITAGQTFAYGLQCLGVVTSVIDASKGLGVSAAVLAIGASVIIFLLAMVMGSGVAPLFAFIPLVPGFAKGLGASPVLMMLPLQNAASLGRLISPITAVIIAVAGIANVSPFDLVKRNFVPVVLTFIASTLAVNFIH